MRRPVWCRAFLIALEENGGNVSLACDLVGRDRTLPYKRSLADHEFSQQFEEARKRAEERLERIVSRRDRRSFG